MSDLLFDPPALPTLGLQGHSARMPIHRIFCIGRNYAAHAAEMGNEIDREAPFFFTKSHAACVPSGHPIAYPQGTTDYHHEIEFMVALETGGRNIPEDQAFDHVLGYGVALDMTRRDLQGAAKSKSRPWDIAKDVDESAILTDLVPAGAFVPGDQEISLDVNGNRAQTGQLSDMIWSVPELIAFLSRLYTLRAGDIILTGTPSGVGPVQEGDTLTGQIDGLPELTCTITPGYST